MENATARAEKTKRHIVDTYFHLILDKKWDRISVKELCDNAEVSRSTFYSHFLDIPDLMEQIQTALLSDLSNRYHSSSISDTPHSVKLSHADFREYNHVETPQLFETWFCFCLDHRNAMVALSDEKNGDPKFRKKIQELITEQLDIMMDADGLPRDSMRIYFNKLVFAMHFYSMYIWLTEGTDNTFSPAQMATMLNTMRIGAVYNSYANCSPANPDTNQK